MTINPLLEQSSRIALAAFLHDLGKFAERARLKVDQQTLDDNKQLYCPHHKTNIDDKGWFSHVHAAYTGLAMDIIEADFPELTGSDLAPFGAWKTQNVDDSFINAAAMHHKPTTFLQWVIATADRVAAGFDRDEFEQYNVAEEGTETGKNHYTARQLTLFEQINQPEKGKPAYKYRYPLKPLSPNSIFPQLAANCETNHDETAQKEYLKLWEEFCQSLKKIPKSHRHNWALWLDHFETLWGVYTQAIPAATAFNVRPDVSLYDHSRVAAALATALWRFHLDQGGSDAEKAKQLKDQQTSWQEEKFLLIQGDFFGIQDFIFANGGETNKRAAKLLRGRSFYVSLLTECAALKVLDALNLPATSQVINAAGKFMLVAANTEATKTALIEVRAKLDKWFLTHSFGQAGVGLAWTTATCKDFQRKPLQGEAQSPYKKLITKLISELEVVKNQRFNLCGNTAPIVFSDFLDSFNKDYGVCGVDGRSPATQHLEDNVYVSDLAHDQIKCGENLTKLSRILITREAIGLKDTLLLDIFGYRISFTADEDAKGKFGEQASNGNLLRVWDFALPESADQALWNGYARRSINAYVPLFNDTAQAEAERGKYTGLDVLSLHDAKTLNHLACEDQILQENHQWQGVSALSALKGDVDNLGKIFENGLGVEVSFTKTAALSRQMNNFFTIYLPWLCHTEFPNTYTVFAGGDDFFLIGPWLSQIKLAAKMQQAFQNYVAHNDQVHFSAGISTTKPGLPINQLGEMAEEALEAAKAHNFNGEGIAPKNAVSCFRQRMVWGEFKELIEQRTERLKTLCQENKLSTGYLYGLLTLIDMAEKVNSKPENALWHSYFAYRTVRMLESNRKLNLNQEQRKLRLAELATEIANLGIEGHRGNYRVTLFCTLYQRR